MNEAQTPHDAWERWCGNQSVSEFMHYSQGKAFDQAVADYCEALRANPPDVYGHGPTEREEALMLRYVLGAEVR